MHILTIIICLFVIKKLNFVMHQEYYRWVTSYMRYLGTLIPAKFSWHGMSMVVATLISLLVPISIIYGIFHNVAPYNLLLDIVLLWFVLPAESFTNKHAAAISNSDSKEDAGIFFKASTTIFAPIFWFLLLGPLMSLLYRLIEIIQRYTASQEDLTTANSYLEVIFAFLNWPAAILVALSFGLAGDFIKVVQPITKQGTDFHNYYELVTNCGLLSLNLDPNQHQLSLEEQQASMALIHRTGIIWICMLAIAEIILLI